VRGFKLLSFSNLEGQKRHASVTPSLLLLCPFLHPPVCSSFSIHMKLFLLFSSLLFSSFFSSLSSLPSPPLNLMDLSLPSISSSLTLFRLKDLHLTFTLVQTRPMRTVPLLQQCLEPSHCQVFRGRKFSSSKEVSEALSSRRSLLLFPGPDGFQSLSSHFPLCFLSFCTYIRFSAL